MAGGGPGSTASRGFRTFADGEIVAGRYQVVRYLAQGGMGEVYEVEDRELGTRVALKTVLPRIASNPVALERFRREILLARKVTHPNVCRIFDIGRHVPDGDEDDAVTFLTMELLEGESLGRRLRRGPLPRGEVLALLHQVAAGLGAAHRAGVIHRDLKPANVFLVPEDGGVRAVVTDFGLARIEAVADGFTEVTGTGEILGTPSYMAPEQLEGSPPSVASDIYALGLVLYEMLTGARAFEGDTAFQVALKRLREPPTAPSRHLPDIDPVWEGTILRCLASDPEQRFTSAEDIVAALSGALPPSAWAGRTGRHRLRALARRRRGWIWVATAAVVAAAVLYPARWWLQGGRGRDQPAVRRSVAVLGFADAAGSFDTAWISTAVAEILTTELAAGGRFRTVPGEVVARARNDLGLNEVNSLAPQTLARLRDNLGSDLVVLGSYTAAGDRLRLDVRVQDATSGELVAQEGVSGRREDLFELVERAAAAVRADLGVGEVAGVSGSASAALPTDPEAARLYSEGVARLRAFDALTAKDLLLRATASDPESPLIYSALAQAWSDLGYHGEQLAAAERAVELASGLGREERTRIAGQYMLAAGKWEDAVQSFSSLWTFFPDNLDYGLELARAEVAAGKAEAALETVAEIRRLPEPADHDPRADLEEAAALAALGRFEEELAAAERAIKRSDERGARLLGAEARLERASALLELGRLDDATASCRQARATFQEAGSAKGVAAAVERLALIAYYQGDAAGAATLGEQALETWRDLGNREGEANTLNLLGAMALERSDLEDAEARFSKVLEVGREISSAETEALALNNLALVRQRRADLPGALDSFEQVLALERGRHDPAGEARALENIGGTYAAGGDLARAREHYEQAVGVYRQLGSRSDLAAALYWLGDVLLWQGELGPARLRHEEALALREQAGEQAGAAESRLALATVRTHEAYLGKAEFATAAADAATALRTLEGVDLPGAKARALALAAEIALVRDRGDEARADLERAAQTAPGDDLGQRLELELLRARVQAGHGGTQEALTDLEKLLKEAEAASLLGTEYEVRLAMAEAELEAGETAAARVRLGELRRDAEARGWFLISERAGRMLAGAASPAAT